MLSMLLRIDLAGLAPLDAAEDETGVDADCAEKGND
jgi:hypothetical protein